MEAADYGGTKKAKRKVKDCVFTNLFGDKKYLLMMYRSLHPESVDVTEDDISIVTLENVLVDDIYNDLGFMVGDTLICLVEAQSTWTMNILIRVILYYAKTLKEYIDGRGIDLYTSTKAEIPRPEFYVVFTGERKNRPDSIRLSDEFFKGLYTGMDVTVRMLYGGGDDIIGEYVAFTKVFNEQRRLHGLTETAVTETVRICKDRNVLREYLESREKEVFDMMVTLFDEEQIMRAHDSTIFERGIEQGIERGIEQGIERGIEQGIIKTVLQFVRDGIITMEDAARRTGMSEKDLAAYR